MQEGRGADLILLVTESRAPAFTRVTGDVHLSPRPREGKALLKVSTAQVWLGGTPRPSRALSTHPGFSGPAWHPGQCCEAGLIGSGGDGTVDLGDPSSSKAGGSTVAALCWPLLCCWTPGPRGQDPQARESSPSCHGDTEARR